MITIALKIGELEQYTNRQSSTVNELVDKVKDDQSICSRSNQSIPEIIDTSGTPSIDSSKLSTAQALIASPPSSLAEAEKNCYQSRNRQGGRGGDQTGGRGSRGGDRRPQGFLGAINNDLNRRLTCLTRRCHRYRKEIQEQELLPHSWL